MRGVDIILRLSLVQLVLTTKTHAQKLQAKLHRVHIHLMSRNAICKVAAHIFVFCVRTDTGKNYAQA